MNKIKKIFICFSFLISMIISQTFIVLANDEDYPTPYWWIDNNEKYFYDGFDEKFFDKPALMVIDVSEHQKEIDWETVKKQVDGAIIRIGYGNTYPDQYYIENIKKCEELNIPYGVYLYSYADSPELAKTEALHTIELLKKIDNLNLSFPIYYDLEKFATWKDSNGIEHNPPTSVHTYKEIVKEYINTMNENGYENISIYSYLYYLNTVLNDEYILKNTSWIAGYVSKLEFNNKYYSGDWGWQYTSSGKIDGINGNVDVNAFTNKINNTVKIKSQINELVNLFVSNSSTKK